MYSHHSIAVKVANRSGMTHPACTSRQCVWNVPSEKIVSKPTKIADRNWKSSKLNKGNLMRYSNHRTQESLLLEKC